MILVLLETEPASPVAEKVVASDLPTRIPEPVPSKPPALALPANRAELEKIITRRLMQLVTEVETSIGKSNKMRPVMTAFAYLLEADCQWFLAAHPKFTKVALAKAEEFSREVRACPTLDEELNQTFLGTLGTFIENLGNKSSPAAA